MYPPGPGPAGSPQPDPGHDSTGRNLPQPTGHPGQPYGALPGAEPPKKSKVVPIVIIAVIAIVVLVCLCQCIGPIFGFFFFTSLLPTGELPEVEPLPTQLISLFLAGR